MQMTCYIKILIASLFLFFSSQAGSWNALGHRLIAQIAYDYMTPEAKHRFNQINHALDKVYKPQSFVNAAVWLDTIHYNNGVMWFDAMHYVNQPFSLDGSHLPEVQKINAIWAIENAIKTLQDKRTFVFDKGIALRVLIHVVGDLHQPLHGATLVTRKCPKGDAGGNLFSLGKNAVADDLHWYWDQGAGLFKTTDYVKQPQLIRRARQIEKQWPCELKSVSRRPTDWLKESHAIAIKDVYQLHPHEKPGKAYQKHAQNISVQRVALAGCRLAAVLNELAMASSVS
ncbi:nuclease [Legionella israelensis]|uniref:Nuclease n=2 Tax=Legionella israelensis TaxID=454 RepID=A0AAX1EG90_9GAMM|nr:nuclease [Legionella israelensis]